MECNVILVHLIHSILASFEPNDRLGLFEEDYRTLVHQVACGFLCSILDKCLQLCLIGPSVEEGCSKKSSRLEAHKLTIFQI